MNNNTYPFLLDEKSYRELCVQFIESCAQLYNYTPKTKDEYHIILRSFRCWMIEHGQTELDQNLVKLWMLNCAQKTAVLTVSTKTLVLTHFLDYLVSHDLCQNNPFSILRKQHLPRGYRGIVRILKQSDSITALDALADSPLSGPLAFHFTDYLDHISALGKSLHTHSWLLKSFERHLRQHNINELNQVDASVVAAWDNSLGQASAHRKYSRLVGLKKFFDFLLAQERIHVSPIPQLLLYRRKSLPPYVFSREEIKNILILSEKLPDHRLMPYRGHTYRMVFLSLYTLGLRINEALNLKLADIDFVQDSITIRDTKFYKGRVLPFGPRFKARLQCYLTGHPLLLTASANNFLFPTLSYRTPRLGRDSCYRTLCRIIQEMSISLPAATQSPRCHSFRHSFAVHRLEKWMREGADVGAKLPLLSAFLGHVDVAATQVYLTMTPERLTLIGEQFEKAFGASPETKNEEGLS